MMILNLIGIDLLVLCYFALLISRDRLNVGKILFAFIANKHIELCDIMTGYHYHKKIHKKKEMKFRRFDEYNDRQRNSRQS